MDRYRLLLQKYWVVVVVVVLMIAGVVAFASGVRLGPGGITQAGTLEVRNLPENARVFLDEAKMLGVSQGTAKAMVTPGVHSVIVDVEGMQPWNELVELSSKEVSLLWPLQVPKTVLRERVPEEQLVSARATLRATVVPTPTAPLVLGECVSVWVSGGRILAKTDCEAPSFLVCEAAQLQADGTCPAAIIFSPSGAVHSVIPFPGRDDALVVAAGSLSYVIELDPRKPQFFAPIAKSAVKLAPLDADTILMEENGTVYRIAL